MAKVDYKGAEVHSLGRNGYFKTSGLNLFRLSPDTIEINGLTSKGLPGSGCIRIPNEAIADAAAALLDLIPKNDGSAEKFAVKIDGRPVVLTQDSPEKFTVTFCGMTDAGLDWYDAKSALGDAIFEALRLAGTITKNIKY